MVIVANKDAVVIRFPSLIQRAYIPIDQLTSHPDTTVVKTKEVVIAGFKCFYFNKLHACNFSTQFLRD